MALSDKDIFITPNRGQTAEPKIEFKGASASLGPQTITLNVYPTNNGTLSFEGSAGQLFSITNDLTGTIYSVNDVSGIPSIEVLDTGLVKFAQYGGNVLIGTGTDNGAKFQLNGTFRNNSIWISDGSTNNAYNENIRLFAAGNGVSTIAFNASGTSGSPAGAVLGYSDRIEIRSTSDSIVHRFYNNYSIALGSSRAPIFYDSDNTGYYVDPAGVSVLNDTRIAAGNTQLIAGSVSQNTKWRALGGSTDLGVSFYDAGDTWRMQLYASSGSYGFLGSNWGSWDIKKNPGGNLYLNGSSTYYHATDTTYMARVYGTVDIRSPLFYDNDDTGYYVDPAGTSNLNKLSAFTMSYNGMNSLSANSPYAARYAGSSTYRNGTMGYSTVDFTVIGSNWGSGFIDSWSSPGNSPDGNVSSTHWVGLQAMHGNNQDNVNFYGWQMLYGGGTNNKFFLRGSWPTQQSWVEILHSGNYSTWAAPASHSHSYLPLAGGTLTGDLTIGSGQTNSSLYMSDSDEGVRRLHCNSNNIGFLNSSNGWGAYCNDAGDWLTDTISYAGTSSRAPIFYDRDDTGYYLDPNSTSSSSLRLRGGTLHGPNPSWGKYLYIGTDGNIDVNTATVAVTNGNLHLDAANGFVMYLNNYATSSYTIISQSARSPIFYDSQDTNYYCDPNSTSSLYRVNINNNIIFTNFGRGMVGTYDSTKLQAVFAMGDAYKMLDGGDGTSNMYGLAWSHPNAGSLGGANNLNDHGLLIINNGSFRAALSSRAVFSADVRGTQFYDYNDTGYYCDPNSTSYLNTLTLSGANYFRPQNWVQLDGSYGLYWPNHYGAHLHANDLSTYTQIALRGNKSSYGGIYDQYSAVNIGMYDSSGNGGVYREANGRWVFYHAISNDCTGFGTSTTNSAYNVYCPKGVYSGGRVDGTIFYDSNNTGYYTDPASTSVMNVVQSNGYFTRGGHSAGYFVGSYNNIGANDAKTNPIYTIGTSYMPSDTSWSNMYGCGYTTPNVGGMPSGASDWGFYVNANGVNRIFLSGGNGGIWATGSITAYASDKRLKTNITPIKNALDKVMRISGVEFDWIDNIQELGFMPSSMHETGVIAQNIQEVIFDAVSIAPFNSIATEKTGVDNNFLTVDKEKIIPLLIEAIKEQQTQIEELKSLVSRILNKE